MMLSVTKNGTNRLDIALSGKIDAEAMRAGLDDLIAKSENIENGSMLYRIGEFDFPTAGAIGVELARIPKLFRLITRFDKVALVAEQGWIRKAGEIEGALIPGVIIKAFEIDEEDDAEEWLVNRK